MRGIGVERNGHLIAGVLFDRFDGANVFIHVASDHKNWLTRGLLWTVFSYAFNRLNVNRITLNIESKNSKSIRFAKSLGFIYEATMFGAAMDDDVLIFRMFKSDCRWLNG